MGFDSEVLKATQHSVGCSKEQAVIILKEIERQRELVINETIKRFKEIIYEEIRMERFAYGQGFKKACDEMEKDILAKLTLLTGKSEGEKT